MSSVKGDTRPRTIYALVDPRDGKVRYVGASIDPVERLQAHLADARGKVRRAHIKPERVLPDLREPDGPGHHAWLTELVDAGLRPDIRILEERVTDWRPREAYWQRQYPVLNRELAKVPPINAKPLVAQALKALREERGYSRSEVAGLVQRSAVAVTRWENGTRTPDVNDLASLAVVYDVDPGKFFDPVKSAIEKGRAAMRGDKGGAATAKTTAPRKTTKRRG